MPEDEPFHVLKTVVDEPGFVLLMLKHGQGRGKPALGGLRLSKPLVEAGPALIVGELHRDLSCTPDITPGGVNPVDRNRSHFTLGGQQPDQARPDALLG